MRKNTKKLVLPAIAAAGAVMGAWHVASADYVVTLSAATNAGGFDTYVASVINNGANGTGTQLLAVDSTVTVNSGGALRIDGTQDVDGSGDGTKDFNFGTTSQLHGLAYGSNTGTFSLTPAGTPSFVSDSENGITDSNTSWSSYNSATSSPNAGFNPALYANVTKLEMVWTASAPNGIGDTIPRNFFNIVVPHGAAGTLSGAMAGAAPATNFATVSFGTVVTTTTPPTVPIVLLSAATPTNVGGLITNGAAGTVAAPQGTYTPLGAATSKLTVAGASNAYTAGFIYNLTTGAASGYTSTAGFSGGDLEIYLLNLKVGGVDPTGAQENTIIADINAANPGVTASLVAASLTSLGGVVNPWDIEIKITPGANENGFFGWNFTGETNVAGVTVTDVAAVPEPATAGLLLVGGLGLLAKRRRAAAK